MAEETTVPDQKSIRFVQAVTVEDGDGKIIEAHTEGEEVTLSTPSADHWLRRGKALEVGNEPPPPEPEKPEATVDELLAVIEQVDEDDEDKWTKNKGPTTSALSDLLDSRPVTAEARDIAWFKFQEAKKPAG